MEYLHQYPHADCSNLSLQKSREKCNSQDAKSSPVRYTIYRADDKQELMFPVAVAKTAPVQHLTYSASCRIKKSKINALKLPLGSIIIFL